jgi:hypothetical protein
MVAGLIQVLFGSRQHTPPGTLPFIGVVTLFATCGIIGSAFLFRGSGWGRRTVRLVALLTTVVALWQIRLDIPLWLGGRLFIEREMLIFAGVALFSLATIMLLHPLRNRDPDPKPVT